MLSLGGRFHDARKENLADTERKKVNDAGDLVETAVDASVVACQIVLGEDDVLTVENLYPHNARSARVPE